MLLFLNFLSFSTIFSNIYLWRNFLTLSIDMYYSKLMTGNWHHFKYCKYLALFLVGIIISKMIYKASTIKAILQGLKITRWYFQEDVSLRQAHMYGSCSTVFTFHWDLIISEMIYKASTIKAILQGLKITRWYFQEDVSLRQAHIYGSCSTVITFHSKKWDLRNQRSRSTNHCNNQSSSYVKMVSWRE